MTQALERRNYTVEEYLELEINSEERHEYLDGEVVCVIGGTPNHNKIALNLAASLNLSGSQIAKEKGSVRAST